MIQPTDRRQLWSFIATWFRLALPHRAFTPGHSTPLDFVADAFFHPGRDVAAWASRSGLKTLGASILAAVEFLFIDGLEARVLSGSEAQAHFLYEYWQRWCAGVLAKRLDGPVRRTVTPLAGGRMEILAASPRRVRGGKVHRLYEDELDEIHPDIDAAAVGMIASRGAIPGRTVYTSTWHRPTGPMGRLIDSAERTGVALHKWNIWESIERCPPERHDHGRTCETCPLGPLCVAKARAFHRQPDRRLGIAAEAGGLYRIDDAIKAAAKCAQTTWQAEWECSRPKPEGLVYPQFDPQVHRRAWAPPALTIYRSIDWGANVFVCLWLGEDDAGRTWLLDTYRAEGATLAHHAEHINAHPLREVRATFCDPAGRNRNDQTGKSNVQVFREQGIRCSYTLAPAAREVRNGVALVRAALSPAAGEPGLFYLATPANRAFERAMLSYRNRRVNGIWIDQPQDPQEHEHIPDALRYYFVNRRRAGRFGVVRLGAS